MAGLFRIPVTGLVVLVSIGLALIGIWGVGATALASVAGLAGLALVMIGAVLACAALVARRTDAQDRRDSFALMAADSVPCFSTDGAGRIVLRNAAAELRFGTDARDLVEIGRAHV